MVCPKCGNNNVENSSFCANCGNALNSVQVGPFDNGIVNTSVPSTNDVNNSVPFVQNTISNPQSISGGSFTSNPSLNQDSVSLPTSNSSPKKFNIMIPIGVGVVFIAVAAMIGLNVFSKPDETNTNNNSSGVSGVSEKQQSLDDNISISDIPIPVKKDGKYGYIDSKGSFVIEPQYKSASDFNGNYAQVSKKEEGKKGTQYYVIDKKGNVKLSASSVYDLDYEYDYDLWVVNHTLYDNSLNKLSADDISVQYSYGYYGYFVWNDENSKKAGIIDKNGKITYSYEFKDGESKFTFFPSEIEYPIQNRYCIINIDDTKYGIINCATGKMVYGLQGNYIEDCRDNIFKISESKGSNFLLYIYIQNDQIMLETSNENASIYSSGGYVLLKDLENNMFLSVDIISNEKFDSLIMDKNPAITYWTEWEDYKKLHEYIDMSNYLLGLKRDENVIIPSKYEKFEYFGVKNQKFLSSYGKDYILAFTNKKAYLLDLKDGKIIYEFSTDRVVIPDDYYTNVFDNLPLSTFILYFDDESQGTMVYNIITGKTKKANIDSMLDIDCAAINYCVIEENNKRDYYNMDLELIYSEEI